MTLYPESEPLDRTRCSLIIVLFSQRLRLGRSSAFSAALLLLNNRDCLGDKFHHTLAAVGAGVQFAVVFEVVISVKIVLSAELATETFRHFSVETVGTLVSNCTTFQ